MKNKEMIYRIGKSIEKLEKIDGTKCRYYYPVLSNLCLMLGKACCGIFKEDNLKDLEFLEIMTDIICNRLICYADSDSVTYADSDSVRSTHDDVQPEKSDENLKGYKWKKWLSF